MIPVPLISVKDDVPCDARRVLALTSHSHFITAKFHRRTNNIKRVWIDTGRMGTVDVAFWIDFDELSELWLPVANTVPDFNVPVLAVLPQGPTVIARKIRDERSYQIKWTEHRSRISTPVLWQELPSKTNRMVGGNLIPLLEAA